MNEKTKPEAAPEPEQKDDGRTFTEAEVRQIVEHTQKQAQEQVAQLLQQRMDTYFGTDEGRKWFSDRYGALKSKPKQDPDDDDDLSEEMRAIRELKESIDARFGQLEEGLGKATKSAGWASERAAARELQEAWEAEFKDVVDEIPELKHPDLHRAMRNGVLSDIAAMERNPEPGEVKKMAGTWWKSYSAVAPLYSEVTKTSGGGGEGGSGPSLPEDFDKLPDDEQETIAKEQALEALLRPAETSITQ